MPNAKASKNSAATEGGSAGPIPQQCHLLGTRSFHLPGRLTVSLACTFCAKAGTQGAGSRAQERWLAGTAPGEGQQAWSLGLPGEFR